MASERPSSTTSSSASSFSQLQDTPLRGFPALREKMKEKEERNATATAVPLPQGQEQAHQNDHEHLDDDEEDDDDELLGGLAFGVRGRPGSRRGTATSRDSRHVIGDQASADISIDEILAMDEEDEAEEAALLQTFVGDGSSSGPTLTNHFGDASIRTSSHGLDAHKQQQPKELNEVVLQQILMESTEDPLPDLAPKDYMDNIVKDLLPPPPPSNDKLNEGRRVGGYKLFRLRSTSSSSKQRPSSLSSITNDPIVLLPKPLRKVSMSMTSEAMRREAGFPTCVVVSRRCIAVGTAHGLVLLFDHLQELKRILGTSTEYGSVTAVDMMPSGDWLVCGHQKGHIVLWDIQTGTMIKTVTPEQAHPSAVIHLRFLSESQIISSDVTGTTYRITFTKSMWRGWTADTLLILNGRAGKVYALASLMSSPLSSALENPLNASALIAFCMPRLVTIVRLEPKIEILFKLGRPKNISASTLPYLSWCKRVVKKDDTSGQLAACDPILAIGWGHHLQLLQVSSSSSTQAESSSSTGENPADGSIRVHLLSSTITENEICGLEWLGNKLLLVLDVKDKLRVLDASDLTEIEVVDTKGMDLIYHTRFSKAQCSFHNSFRTLKDRVYLLGMDNIYWGHILSWEERITLLVEQRRWLDALSLALKFYEGRGKGLVDKGVGLPSNSQTRRSLVSDKIIQVLLYYLRTAVSAIFPSASNTTISHNDLTSVSSTSSNSSDSTKNDRLVTKRMVRLGSICMEYLLHIARPDVLFEQIYPLYCKLGQQHTFLELMEPFILEEKLVYLPPELMQAFVSHYASKNMLKTVEQCILHLDLASMDFHHIVKLCREHYLSSGLIYVYNQGLEDYITPLDDMMRLIRSKRKTDLVKGETTSTTSDISSTSGGSQWKSVGYKILLYVSYCLLGKAFPQGSIPRHLVTSVKVDVLNYLFQKNVVGEEEEYVHLVCMLLFDTKEFLSAISIAFDDPTIPPPKEEMEKPMLNHQQMLGVLEGIMVPGSVKSSLFNEEQVGYFFSFIAEYVAKERVSVSPALMNKVVSYLTRSPDASTAVKRQQLMLHIMSLPSARWDQNTLLMVEGASPEPFYAVAELYYRQRKDYKQVIRCYLKDQYRRTEVFTMLRTLLDDASIAEQQMQEIRQAVVANITDLIKIDPHASCSLITNYFTKDQNHQIMRELSKHPKLQYEYLDAILGPESVYQTSNLGSGRLAGELMEETTGKEMQQTYIALMCQFAPSKVYRHLQASDTRVSFEYCLALCKRHNITDATAYLLERTGDVISALDIILQKLKEEMRVMFAAQEANELNALPEAGAFPAFPHTKEEKKVQETLRAAISLCQRNSQRSGVDDAESVALWFRLLDALVVPLRDFKKKGRGLKQTQQGGSNAPSNKTKSFSRSSSSSRPSPSLSFSRHRSASQTVYSLSVSEDESLPRGLARSTQAITLQIQNVLHNMMGYVPLQAILSKIVHDHGADDFGDFKSIIRGVLDSYSYEEAILRSVNKLLRGDMYDSFREYWYLRNRAYVPSKQTAASQQHSTSDHHLSSAMMTKMKGTAMRGGNGVCHLCGATFSDPNFLLMEEKRSTVGVAVFPCGHCFHGSCLGKFRACPLCNRHNKKPNDKNKEKEKEKEEEKEGGEEYRSRLPTERVQDLIANKNDSNKDDPSRLGANTKDTIRASLNTNPENLKDYLQRVDKFKPQEYSRLDMLYQLAGQTRKKSSGRVTRATKTAKQERALKARSRVYPSSASSSGSWRRGVRLTAEELQEQGFQLQTMDKHS